MQKDEPQIMNKGGKRGSGFPKLLLSSAVSIIENVSKFGRQWTRQTFANYGTRKGKGSVKSGAFTIRLASLKDYGLIEITDELISRTKLADKIVNPISEKEKKEAIKEAFLNANLFKQLMDTITEGEELSKEEIAAFAVNQMGVSRSSKDKFISSFIQSGKYAGKVIETEDGNIKLVYSSNKPHNTIQSQGNIDEPLATSPKAQKPLYLDSATNLGTRKFGSQWEINLSIRFDMETNQELFKEITDMVLKADYLAKKFSDQEKKIKKEEKVDD